MDHSQTPLITPAERDRLLTESRIQSRRAATLARAVDLLYAEDDPQDGIEETLALCCEATQSDAWFLAGSTSGRPPEVIGSSDPCLKGAGWPAGGPTATRSLCVDDLNLADWAAELPDRLRAYRSLLSVAVDVPFHPVLVIGLLSHGRAAHVAEDQALLRRVGDLLHQVLSNRPLARHNATAASMGDADLTVSPAGSQFVDNSFEALRRTIGHVADWQGQIVDITNELLSAPCEARDDAIHQALGRMGTLASSDRTYVFRLRDGGRMGNTHEWVAPGIEPMIQHLQDMPSDLLDDWRDELFAGRVVQIPDVEALAADSAVTEILRQQGIRSLMMVPMLRDGAITGFVGYDAVREPRQYLTIEIQLLQSVCNAIRAVLERAEAETRAELARQSLKATLLAVPDLVLELDQDGRFIGVYAGPEQASVLPEHLVIGRRPEQVLPPHVAALANRIIETVKRDGHCDPCEYQMEADGVGRTYVASGAAKMMNGQRVGYVLATRDISRRVEERRKLQRLGKIAEVTSNLVVITDLQQRIEWANPAFERRTGWTLAEVRGRRADSLLASEHANSDELARVRALLRTGRPACSELLNRTRSGEEFWTFTDIQPVFDAGGSVEGFVVVQTDITELKKSHQRALHDRALAMDASFDGIAMTDESGHYIYMNPAHRTMFGINLSEDIHHLNWKELYSPEVLSRFLTEDWPRLQESGAWRGELYGRHRDGHVVAQEVSLTLREHGLLCITRDISKRLQAEKDRARQREDLQHAQSRETLAQLAGGVAHDLNNLVAVVAGSATLLRAMCKDNDETKAGVDRILRATETATDLVAGLGHLGRPQRSRSVLDLRRIATEALDLLGTQRIRDYDITLGLPDAPCPVWANVTELLQVVVNLALNACQAGGNRPNIVRLAVWREGHPIPAGPPDVGKIVPGRSCSLIEVSDTGTGIDPKVRSRLFERYFTTKGSNGTGLGLPIVAGILRDNDAALWIDSTPGKGTTVTVAWPARPAPQDSRTPIVAKTTVPNQLDGHRILVVDDMSDVADVLSEMLESAGAISVAVSDPAEALELLRENPGLWSVVVTDQDMPGLRGSDLARAAAACRPPVPVVLVTALNDAVGSDVPLFHEVLGKPVSAARLIAAVGRAVPGQALSPRKPSPD